MTQQLQDVQAAIGATFEGTSRVAVSFGNDLDAIRAAREQVALCDYSHWGRILVSGSDRLRFYTTKVPTISSNSSPVKAVTPFLLLPLPAQLT